MKKLIRTLITGIMVVFVIGAVPLMAQTIQEKVTKTPDKTISPAEESTISSAAAKVLRHIAGARGAIHDKKLDQAKNDLNQAKKLIEIIKVSLPTTKVKDHIWVAKKHLEYENTEDVKPDLVPIYSALEDIEDFVPVDQARKHLDATKKALEKGNKETAKKSLKAVDAALIYTEIDLPLASTEKHIIAAQKMLAQKKTKEADKELKVSEDSVQYISILPEAPITLAKKSLLRATKDYTAGEYTAAKKDLEKAGAYLKQVAKSADKKTKEEAKKLGNDISALTSKVEKGGSVTGAAVANLWERSKALSEREAERISTGWQKLRAENKSKKDLIEAKLHLAFAETYQFTTGEVDKAKAEIGKADNYMKIAAKHADSKTKSKIKDMKKEIDQIKGNLHSKKETAKEQYIKVISDLRQLIRDL